MSEPRAGLSGTGASVSGADAPDGRDAARTIEPILHPGAAGIAAALRRVVDPEVGLDVVRLGLVYGIEWTGEGVRVIHTFTTPGCPLAGHLERAMRVTLEALPQVGRVELRYTAEPAWHPDMILGWDS